MRSFTRAERISTLVKDRLSGILLKEINDPRLEMVTITDVEISSDLKYARIYYAVSGGTEKQQSAGEGFKSAYGYIKRILAEQLGLRYMPEIQFLYDESFDYGSRIDTILKTLNTDDTADCFSSDE